MSELDKVFKCELYDKVLKSKTALVSHKKSKFHKSIEKWIINHEDKDLIYRCYR